MASETRTSGHYRDQAAELRRMAGLDDEPILKEKLLKLARDYDRLAQRAERADKSRKKP